VAHYEEDIFLLTGATSGFYVTGGLQVLITKSVQIQLLDHVTQKAVSSAASLGWSGSTPIYAPVVASESGQAFRLRAYGAISGASGSGLFTELPPGSAMLQGLPIHVSYEGT
jgi:hypothetical protein